MTMKRAIRPLLLARTLVGDVTSGLAEAVWAVPVSSGASATCYSTASASDTRRADSGRQRADQGSGDGPRPAALPSDGRMVPSTSGRSDAVQPRPRGGGQRGDLTPRPPRGVQQAGTGQLSDLALENAPTKVLQLIGDPRSGVADDVTDNPFGSITCDMVHHQPSNEVFWYKYEFAGDQLQQGHRDGRLSEYSKNLMYLLRAKDPNRWTIPALAHKFRIREQRVLAILALKDMEGASMELEHNMSGPLSPYACTVHLEDVSLDSQGDVLPLNSSQERQAVVQQVEACAKTAASPESVLLTPAQIKSGVTTPVDSSTLPLHVAIPRTRLVAQQLQQQLGQVLAQCDYDLGATRVKALAGLDAAIGTVQAAARSHSGDSAQDTAGSEESEDSPPAQPPAAGSAAAAAAVAASLTQLRQATAALYDTLEAVLLEPQPTAAGSADSSQPATSRQWRSPELEGHRAVGVSAAAVKQALQAAESPDASSQLQQAISGLNDRQLLRVVQSLPNEQRVQFLQTVPEVAARLNAAHADLQAMTSSTGSSSSSNSDSQAGSISTDPLGGMFVSAADYRRLTAALQGVQDAQAALTAAHAQLAGKATARQQDGGAHDPVEVVKQLQRLSQTYSATLWAVQELHPNVSGAPRSKDRLKLMQEADPASLERLTYVEAAQQLEAAGQTSEAAEIRAKLRQSAGQQPVKAEDKPVSGLIQDDVGSPRLGALGGADSSWDAVAAWLDSHPGQKVFHRGSGERQVARVPSYPAFEGLPLSAMDTVEESQLSQLNRQLAQKQEQELVHRFRHDLLFNLGLRGPNVWDGSTPRSESNLGSQVDKPLVVYNISDDGVTQYPPLFVVELDGCKRPLNEDERVWQERRIRHVVPREHVVHYTVDRIKRKTELQ